MEKHGNQYAIAIVGIGCTLPGVRGVDQAYERLVAPSGLASTPPSRVLDNVEDFDYQYFGIAAQEAAIMNPQQKRMLECVADALDDAGLSADLDKYRIGIFCSGNQNNYRADLETKEPKPISAARDLQIMLANDIDYLASRIAYTLNLKGPAMSLQAACSSSLLAVHTAVLNLLTYQCDVAIAGGVCVRWPRHMERQPDTGGPVSLDGVCRPFDVAANGTVLGEGAGAVILKRLEDAEREGDRIYALISGSSINNDGCDKAGFSAPSARGQKSVIQSALQMAGVPADSIGYVEAHGTGTSLGDRIEFRALLETFNGSGMRTTPCYVGACKADIGHLENAAGVLGLIKASLCLYRGAIPPMSNFSAPHPDLNLGGSRFSIPTDAIAWPRQAHAPRRAAISSFGMGGTNAHAILEEAPLRVADAGPRDGDDAIVVLNLSAGTAAAATLFSEAVADLLERDEGRASARDIAYSLARRKTFAYRISVAGAPTELAGLLRAAHPAKAPAATSLVALVSRPDPSTVVQMRHVYAVDGAYRTLFDGLVADMARQAGIDAAVLTGQHRGGRDGGACSDFVCDTLLDAIAQKATFQYLGDCGLAWSHVHAQADAEITAAFVAGWLAPDDLSALVRLRQAYHRSLSGSAAPSRFEEQFLDAVAHPGATAPDASANEDATAARLAGAFLRIIARAAGSGMTLQASLADGTAHCLDPRKDTARMARAFCRPQRPVSLDRAVELPAGAIGYDLAQMRSATAARPLPSGQATSGLCARVQPHADLLADVGVLWTSGAAVDWRRFPFAPASLVSLPVYPYARSAPVGSLALQARLAAADIDLSSYQRVAPVVDRLCAAYVVKAFHALGIANAHHEAVEIGAVLPKYQKLVQRFVQGLPANQDLAASSPEQTQQLIDQLEAGFGDFPEHEVELELMRRCGLNLGDVLAGRVSPLVVLFPDDSQGARQLYEKSPQARAVNRAVQAVVATLGGASEGVRIAEVGGGTASSTAGLLHAPQARIAHYCFTDISPYFVGRARREFAHVAGFEARTLDIEIAPSAQGISVGSYDLVVANNVIHATTDIRQSILHCMDMLAPHGKLILVEGTMDSPWLDITFGLTDGWWRFDDGLARVLSPLLPTDAWRTLFEGLHLRADIVELPGDGSGILSRQVVCIVERLPSAPQAAPGRLPHGDARPAARAEAAAQPAGTRSTALQMLLRDIWAQAFALPEVNDDTDFFDLGGDSLTAVQIGSVLKRELGVDLDFFGMLLDHPTLGAFTPALERHLVQEQEARLPADLDLAGEC